MDRQGLAGMILTGHCLTHKMAYVLKHPPFLTAAVSHMPPHPSALEFSPLTKSVFIDIPHA